MISGIRFDFALPPNGLRHRRGGFVRHLDIMARNFANRASFGGAVAPSGGRFVSRRYFSIKPIKTVIIAPIIAPITNIISSFLRFKKPGVSFLLLKIIVL